MDKNKLLEIGYEKRDKLINTSWDDLNKQFGFPFKNGEVYRSWVKKQAKKDGKLNITHKEKQIHNDFNDKDFDTKSSIEIHNDGRQTSSRLLEIAEEQRKDPKFLLKAHGYDYKFWELVSARDNEWNVYSKQDGIQNLFSSKIVVRPLQEYVWNEEDAKRVFEKLESKSNITPICSEQFEKNGNILLLPIADLHYGLYSDMMSTGNEYNIEIAENNFYNIIYDIKNRVSNRKFEKVVFVVGNDFVNSDNLSNTTTKGTPQDTMTTWFNIIEKTPQLIVGGTNILKKIAPVDILYVPSNHDLHTMFGVMQILKAHYRKDNDISVDTSPLPRKFYKYGFNLLMFSHDMKIKNALEIVSTEGKNEWSNCKHIICMLAHLHKEMVYDKKGYLEIMRLPTISGWSRWTNNNGYVSTEKKNQAFIVDKEKGIVDVLYTIL